MTTTKLSLSIFDLNVPDALASVARIVGDDMARNARAEAGTGLFVVYGRNGDYTLHTGDDSAVIEAVATGLNDAAMPGRVLKLAWKVGPLLDAQLKALLSAHNRQHTAGVVSAGMQ
jgi:hypothetical protein